MSDALLPCPFCGGEAEVKAEKRGFKIRCVMPACEAAVYGFGLLTNAIRAWNRRASPAPDALRDDVINRALDRIAYLTDSGQFKGYRSEVWRSVEEVYDAALRSGDGCKPPEVRRNEDGTPDEVVADHAQVHLEQMSDTHWWLSIAQGGSTVLVNLMSRGKIGGTLEVEAGPDVDEAMAKPAGDGWTRVEFREGIEGEWTCSGCGRDWVCETETPEANGYKFCPGCGGRIIYVPLSPAPEDR